MDQVAKTIHDMMTEEIRLIVTSGNPDASGLLRAMLLVGVEATDLNVPEVLVLVAQVLAQYEAAMNPVPQYLDDWSVRHIGDCCR